MNNKTLRKSGLLALIWTLIALVAVTSATFAWFTFAPYTNVTPMTGTVSGGDGSLLISNRRDGEFSDYCDLVLSSDASALAPLSTADLNAFYTTVGQTSDGIATRYTAATDRVNGMALHGTVYLLSQSSGHVVYFDPAGLDFGKDAQALAALRLGLRITTQNGVYTHIFRLDEMADTSAAEARLTVPQRGTVVASLAQGGAANYQSDPAKALSPYYAQVNSDEDVAPGRAALCTLARDEVASVEYWLYLEGCDENCINAVQKRDVALQLAFAGVLA